MLVIPILSMKSYFVTLGFTESYLIRLLNETSAQREDKLVIIVPSPIASGTKSTLESIKAQAVKLNYPEPEVYEIEISDFDSAFSQILDHLLPLPEPIVSDLTLGMRLMNTLILLAIIVSGKRFTIYVREEGGGSKVLSFNKNVVNALLRDYSKEELKLLSILANTGLSVSELATIMGKSEKTLINKLTELRKLGTLHQKGKDRKVELTSLGLNVVKLKLGGQKVLEKAENQV